MSFYIFSKHGTSHFGPYLEREDAEEGIRRLTTVGDSLDIRYRRSGLYIREGWWARGEDGYLSRFEPAEKPAPKRRRKVVTPVNA